MLYRKADLRILRGVLIIQRGKPPLSRVAPEKKQFSGMTALPAPRGRPPAGCIWDGGRYINLETGEAFLSAVEKQRHMQRRRAYERARYWNPSTKVRLKRLERAARESGKPRRPVQLKLDAMLRQEDASARR